MFHTCASFHGGIKYPSIISQGQPLRKAGGRPRFRGETKAGIRPRFSLSRNL